MGDSKLSPATRPDRPETAAGDPPLVWPVRGPAPNRHGAISRQLFSYSHYKKWADRMRNSWQDDDEATADEAPSVR